MVETYVRVDGRWMYLYRAVDEAGQLHAVGEWVDLQRLRACTRVLAGTLIDWCGVT